MDKKALAKGGFYFTGYSDRVKCFACGRTVERWEPSDNPLDLMWHKYALLMFVKLITRTASGIFTIMMRLSAPSSNFVNASQCGLKCGSVHCTYYMAVTPVSSLLCVPMSQSRNRYSGVHFLTIPVSVQDNLPDTVEVSTHCKNVSVK